MGRSLDTRLLQRECGYKIISHHVQYPWAHSPHCYSVEFLADVLPCLTHSLRTKHPHLYGKVGLPPFGKLNSLVGREQAHKTPVDFKNDNPLPLSLSHPPLSPWKAHMWNIRFTSLTLGSTAHSNRGRECTRTATSRSRGSCTGCRGQTQTQHLQMMSQHSRFTVNCISFTLYTVYIVYCMLFILFTIYCLYCLLYTVYIVYCILIYIVYCILFVLFTVHCMLINYITHCLLYTVYIYTVVYCLLHIIKKNWSFTEQNSTPQILQVTNAEPHTQVPPLHKNCFSAREEPGIRG